MACVFFFFLQHSEWGAERWGKSPHSTSSVRLTTGRWSLQTLGRSGRRATVEMARPPPAWAAGTGCPMSRREISKWPARSRRQRKADLTRITHVRAKFHDGMLWFWSRFSAMFANARWVILTINCNSNHLDYSTIIFSSVTSCVICLYYWTFYAYLYFMKQF